MKPINVEITDEFQHPTGEWTNYTGIVAIQNVALRQQKHANIRSFVPDKPAALITMLLLTRLTMYDLDQRELGTISSDVGARSVVVNNEGWTFGTVGPQADRSNWNGISVECDPAKSALTVTQSVIVQNG